MKIQFTQAASDLHLRKILALQQVNTEAAISAAESRDQGFVTVRHDLDLLRKMNNPYGHIIAMDEHLEMAGYLLVMLPELEQEVPILEPLVQKINTLSYEGKPLKFSRYFIMGQACVAKPFRGRQVFSGLYEHMKKVMAPDYDFIITSIATRNTRSMRAHQKVGFRVIERYMDHAGDEWVVVLCKTG